MATVRDYYLVRVPGDVVDTLEGLADIAIREVRERTRIYAMPCEWQAKCLSGGVGSEEVIFRVSRRRRRPSKGA